MKRRILALLLAIAMLMSMLPGHAFASETGMNTDTAEFTEVSEESENASDAGSVNNELSENAQEEGLSHQGETTVDEESDAGTSEEKQKSSEMNEESPDDKIATDNEEFPNESGEDSAIENLKEIGETSEATSVADSGEETDRKSSVDLNTDNAEDDNTETCETVIGEKIDWYLPVDTGLSDSENTDGTQSDSDTDENLKNEAAFAQSDKQEEEPHSKLELDTLDTGFALEGKGIEEDPYLIKCAGDFETISRAVNQNGNTFSGSFFRMETDIELDEGWIPIGALIDSSLNSIQSGENMHAFGGIIDGNGKTLTIPVGGLPLLGYVQGAVVRNLNIYGEQIAGYGLVNNMEGVGLSGEAIRIENVTLKSGTKTLKSGLIGTYITDNSYAGCSSGFTVTISNCHIEENVIVGYNKDQSMIGSFAGRVNGTIENCTSCATVYGIDYVGGILGMRDHSLGKCLIESCTFGGTVEATGQHVGGIAGGGYSSTTAPNARRIFINDCMVTGNVTGEDKIGGILGGDSISAQVWNAYTFHNNTFLGKIRATTSGVYIGGIIGYYHSLNKMDDISGNYFSASCGAEKGVGGVTYIDTSCATHETASGAVYFNTAEGLSGLPAIEGCEWRVDHNRTDDPLGADATLLWSNTPVAVALTISGSYKTEYTLGELLQWEGAVFTVSWKDGTTTTVLPSDVIVSGYDPNRLGEQTVTLTYLTVSTNITVSVQSNEIKILEGLNSIWDADQNDLTIRTDAPSAEFVGLKLDRKDVAQSNYTVSGDPVSIVLKKDYLKTMTLGEHTITLVFRSTEISTGLTIHKSDTEVLRNVKELIDAIGTDITKDSKTSIENAETAYADLSDAQKTQFNATYPGYYNKLTEARKLLDELLSKVTVSVSVYGHYVHNSDEDGEIHSMSDGGLTLWASGSVVLDKGSTVLKALQSLLSNNGMSYSVTNGGNYIKSISKGGTTLSDSTNGANCGWLYSLNGSQPDLGVGENIVNDGDQIVFHYTDNYTGVSPATAVKNVIDLIKAIETPITLESKDKIDAARSAYDRLTTEQKKKVTNYKDLETAEEELKKLLIKEVETLINQIGTVTLESESKLATAWNAYNALTPEQQLKVTNRTALFEADKKYNTLRAEEVEKLIDEIGEEITLDSEEKIVKARTAFDLLTQTQKDLVDAEHQDKLKKAELALAELKAFEEDKKKAQEVIVMIDDLGVITLDSEEAIEKARTAYEKLTELQKNLVTNYDVLVEAERKLESLKDSVEFRTAYDNTRKFLMELGTPGVGSVGGEWMVIGLARSGNEIGEEYYKNAVAYILENIDEQGRLHRAKSSDNSRMILALTAIGKDVTNVQGHNLLSGLSDMDYIEKQGINGPIWALLALDSGNYPVPENGNVTRDGLLRTILGAQLRDGGWALSGEESDPDMTGMALQALAPYCQSEAVVQAAVDRALVMLSGIQGADGSFASIDGSSCESIAQIIVALTALRIDPNMDARFVKNGTSVLDALLMYSVADGGFKHVLSGNRDGLATEQGYYALAAYFRFLDGKSSLYDMTDVIDMGGDRIAETPMVLTESTEPIEQEKITIEEHGFPLWIPVVIALGCTLTILLLILNQKKGKYQ